MTLKRGKFLPIMILSFLGVLLLITAHSLAGAMNILDFNVTCPTITSNVPFDMSIKVKNNNPYPVSFDRATIAYVNPDLTFKGPFEVTFGAKTLAPGKSTTVVCSATIVTSQPSGSLVPLSVTLFWAKLSTGDPACFRGTTLAGAKVK
jgi:hypothetical protein